MLRWKIPQQIYHKYMYLWKTFRLQDFPKSRHGGLGSARVGASMGLQDASRAGETWGREDSGPQTPPVELDAKLCPKNSMLMSWGVLFFQGLLFDLLCVGVTSWGAEVQLDSSCGGALRHSIRECRRNKAWLPNHAPIQYTHIKHYETGVVVLPTCNVSIWHTCV